jgi:hypothetical protein
VNRQGMVVVPFGDCDGEISNSSRLAAAALESRGQDEDANQGCQRNDAAGHKSTPVASDKCHAMCHVASPKVIQTTNAAGFIAFRQRLALRALATLLGWWEEAQTFGEKWGCGFFEPLHRFSTGGRCL